MEENKNIPQRIIDTRAAWAANDAIRDAMQKEPEDVQKFKDISYGPRGDWNLMDIFLPGDFDRNGNKKIPVIVNIHGGGYFYGDKELGRFYCMHLVQYGFAVVSFNYRLSPEYVFPAALEDIHDVFIWLEKHGEEYGLDLDNLFAIGDSAGAQLANHYAAMVTNPKFMALYDLPEHHVKIRGLALACGFYDLVKFAKDTDQFILDYLGENVDYSDPRLDVKGHMDGNYPPTFIFSAVNDFLFSSCEPMAEYMKSLGIPVECKIYGSKEREDVSHVFHINLDLDEGKKANVDQTNFMKSLIVE